MDFWIKRLSILIRLVFSFKRKVEKLFRFSPSLSNLPRNLLFRPVCVEKNPLSTTNSETGVENL